MVEISIRKRPVDEAAVTQRKFFKKTARGKVIKGALAQPWSDVVDVLTKSRPKYLVLRERYLRDDVSCGLHLCKACTIAPNAAIKPSPASEYAGFPNGHYVLPDTNVFLSQVCHRPVPTCSMH